MKNPIQSRRLQVGRIEEKEEGKQGDLDSERTTLEEGDDIEEDTD